MTFTHLFITFLMGYELEDLILLKKLISILKQFKVPFSVDWAYY